MTCDISRVIIARVKGVNYMIKTTVKIDGMMCGMCESHVNDAVRKALKVEKVSSSHKRGETVIISQDAISDDDVRAAIEPTGYTVKGVASEPYEKKGGLLSFLGR